MGKQHSKADMQKPQWKLEVTAGGETRLLYARDRENLMEALLRQGLAVSHPCGGKGKCAKCVVRASPLEGMPESSEIRTRKGLSCLMKVTQPLRVTSDAKWSARRKKGMQAEDTRLEHRTGNGKEKARGEAGGKRTQAPSGRNPPTSRIQLPFTRTCVHLPALTPDVRSRWAWLHDAFPEKEKKALDASMETLLSDLIAGLPPTGGPVTLVRAGKRVLGLEAGDTVKARVGAAMVHHMNHWHGLLLDVDAGTLLHLLTGVEAPDAGAFLAILCDAAQHASCKVTDVALAVDARMAHRLTGLPWGEVQGMDASGMMDIPMVLQARSLSGTEASLPISRTGGVWLAPCAAADVDGGHVMAQVGVTMAGVFREWVLAEAKEHDGSHAPVAKEHEGSRASGKGGKPALPSSVAFAPDERTWCMLSGITGCLLDRKTRKEAIRVASGKGE